MRRARSLVVSSPPYVFQRQTTASLMWGTAAAIAPAAAWGIFSYGARAAMPLAAAIVAAVAGEAAVAAASGRFTLHDGSAFLTGLLIGLAMPAGISPFIPAASALFAVVIVKGSFGGLGSNWMNPALGGIVFATLNWPKAMVSWPLPRQLAEIGCVSGATPLGLLRMSLGSASAGAAPIDILSAAGVRTTAFDRVVTDAVNDELFSRIGAALPRGYIDLMIGNRAGTIGELSGILILAASIFLIARKMIRWEIPASIVGGYSLLVWVFGGLSLGNGLFAGDVLFSLFTGSILLVAFFMATDPVTSPSSASAMTIYGLGIGTLAFILRQFGSKPEGSAFAVLIMNCLVPVIERSISKGRSRNQRKSAGKGERVIVGGKAK